nr:hypothetical protein [Sphingomonas sp.]
MPGEDLKDQHKGFTIYIDGEPYAITDKTMTANAILAIVPYDVNQYYLVELKGNHQDSYQDRGTEIIHLHEGAKFLSVFTGPTTVAHGQLTGAALFAAQLRAVGYDVEKLPDGHVKFPYAVEVGKHAGLQVELGFHVPDDFPLTPPHGPHINQRLRPNQQGGCHPTGGIHCSSTLSKFPSGWEHWSRPHPNWTGGPRTAVRYMAFIHHLWATQ